MTHVERLVKIYTDSRQRLLKEIEKRILWGRSTYAQEQLLKEIDRELKRLNLESYAWADEAIHDAYMKAARTTYLAAYSFDKGIKAFPAFGGLHKKAIDILAHNTQDYLAITNNLIARQAKDQVREIGVELISRKFGEGLTVQQTKKALMERFQQENFYAVPWRNGKGAMRVDSYSELVARTTTREATMTATYNQAEALGHHLYKMTAHSTTCKVCASRQGRVYRSVDYPAGDVRNAFPRIEEGFPRWPKYKTVHPNCGHVAVMFIWGQKSKDEQQAALARASEPFNHDPRGEAERKRYEDAQRKNAERLRDRKQWERYMKVLGKENVPKTLSAFRTMKKSGNENWQEMSSDYRHALRIIKKDAILESDLFRSLPMKGEPFSLKDLIRADGTVKQRRLYGADGRPLKDIDTSDHGNPKLHPDVPHAHDWSDGKRQVHERLLTDREKRQNKDLMGGDEGGL